MQIKYINIKKNSFFFFLNLNKIKKKKIFPSKK
jgi:hypothetical protein